MSKHWKPPAILRERSGGGDEPVRTSWHGFNQPRPRLPHYLRPSKRLKGLDEFTLPDFTGRPPTVLRIKEGRVRRRHRLPEGAKAGLVLVAAACLGIAIGLYQAFAPFEIFAPGSETEWEENR